MIKKIKKLIMKFLIKFKYQIEYVLELECLLAKKWVYSAHKKLMFMQWGVPPNAEHYDQELALYYYWQKTRNSLWVERGVFSSLVIKGGEVLELACGSGFNTRNFYSFRSKSVIACDFDKNAIATAIKKSSAPNVTYVLADIRTDMPGRAGQFDNVIWDAAIEHFTVLEIKNILKNIKIRLLEGGVLSGYTILERASDFKYLHQHEYEFKSKEDLLDVLKPHFKNVKVFETIYPDRTNLYFWCSDDVLPFDQNWAGGIFLSQK